MLEIRKGTAAKNYENTFFREFAENLKNLFDKYSLDGLLTANSECEAEKRLQIDALLVTEKAVCIIDFKNFGGKITLPKNAKSEFDFGKWTNEKGDIIKGGNSINPYIQLKNQKERFIKVIENKITDKLPGPDCFNPYHTVRIVCFQKPIELIGSIPTKEELNFFIIDKANYLEKIKDIIDISDKEVSLSKESFNIFKETFRADLFDLAENYGESVDFTTYENKLDFESLYPDQKAALKEIKLFLENPEQNVFILQGTINSGKSHLIPFIQEVAYNSHIQETEIFAASSRIAKNLFSANRFDNVNSIYSFIYGGLISEDDSEANEEENEVDNNVQEISDELHLKVVPIKKSDNSETAVFIVDEAQLVSDSYYQSIDLIFGSGYLLNDFINFTNFNSTKRKIIFVGDPYQIQFGRTDETPLNPTYLSENYKLNVSSFQLLDKPDFSDINLQALNCVQSIKENLFNSLEFIPGNQLSILENEDKLPSITSLIENNIDGHILSFSNEEAQKVNYWIKKSIIKTGEDIAPNDLVLINNNISVEDENDPFAGSKNIYNGQFATIVSVSQGIISETINIKGRPTTINFRELAIKLNETGHQVKLLSLENYRLNLKAELSKDEIIAIKVILNTQLYSYIKENPFEKSVEHSELISSNIYQTVQNEIAELKQRVDVGEKVRGKLNAKEVEQRKLLSKAKRIHRNRIENALRKDTATKYHKYKNAAMLRFGWAMTIDKSTSYKWNEVIVNIEPGSRFNNLKIHEPYFRLIYTALCRAKQKVSLINYKPISPFKNVEIKDQNSGIKPRDIFFHSENSEPESRLTELKEFIVAKLPEFKIRNVEYYDWQERYFIVNDKAQEAIISFSYNGRGNFKLPSIIGGNNELAEIIIKTLKEKTELNTFETIPDSWRKREYQKLKNDLAAFDIKFELILQSNWKDKIRFFSGKKELEIELDYDGDGMVSFVTAKYYSDETIWNKFLAKIDELKDVN